VKEKKKERKKPGQTLFSIEELTMCMRTEEVYYGKGV